MKFKLTFKTPGVLDDITKPGPQCEEHEELDEYCQACIAADIRLEEINAIGELTDKFIAYEECITVEFDTDNGTAVVVEQ
jgi:hypothetical protein